MEYCIASAFSRDGSGGNKAGIVTDGRIRSVSEKTAVAAVIGFSETVFSYKSVTADFRLEYFTPAGEVPLCGHATIAFFIYMYHSGQVTPGHYVIETAAGYFGVDLLEDGRVFMEQAKPEFMEQVDMERLRNCFCPLSSDNNMLPCVVSTGLRDIILPIFSQSGLFSMSVDFDRISELSRDMSCIGIHAFALCNKDTERIGNTGEELTAVCRNFAPLYGIDEESATGTSNCALACYLYRHGIRPEKYIFEQGHHLGSISRIEVLLSVSGDEIVSVRVGGEGYVVKIA